MKREPHTTPPDRETRPGKPPETLIGLLLTDAEKPSRIDGVVVGTLEGFDGDGTPLVDFPLNPEAAPLAARTTVALAQAHVGQDVALLFEQANPRYPLVIGRMWVPAEEPPDAPRAQARVDEERLVFTAKREIVLQCGDASLTLTRAGKVLIRGAFVLTDASGVNRIRGGSVQIN